MSSMTPEYQRLINLRSIQTVLDRKIISLLTQIHLRMHIYYSMKGNNNNQIEENRRIMTIWLDRSINRI